MFVICILLLNFLLVQSKLHDLAEAEGHFNEFINAHDKQYQNEEEKLHRLLIFTENLKEINRKNAQSASAVYGITQFSDMTKDEFLAHVACVQGLGDPVCSVSISEANSTIAAPDSFDWREKKVVSRIKDQQRCGSCWAFGAAGAVESQYAIKHKKIQELSEQQLVDCDDRSAGCSGTSALEHPYFYYMENGAMAEKDYPYESRDGKCRYKKEKVKVEVKECMNFAIRNDEEKLKNLLHQYGPATIAVDAAPLQHYTGGIVKSPECDSEYLNHAVLLVGYGSENGIPYWVVKNSWGESFGEQGFFRIQRGINCINLTRAQPVVPILA